MKKIFSLLIAIACVITFAQAQTGIKAPKKEVPKKETVKKTAPAKVAAKPAAKAPVAQHLKKDGPVDKRYNENKNLKKDGTPDMRYNTSKKAAAKKG